MPRAPKACPHCDNPQPCPQHKPKPWATKQPWHSRGFQPATRRAILNRDNWTCVDCGHRDPTGNTLQADHITPTADGGTNSPDNGRTLCTTCHDHLSATHRTRKRWP